MHERNTHGVALGLVIAVTLGAAGGMLMSRFSAEASVRSLPTVRPLLLGTPEAVQPVVKSAAQPRVRSSVSRDACGPRAGRTFTFRVHVSKSIDVAERAFARQVRAVLCDERGWTNSGWRFRYDPKGTYMVSLRPAEATERRCLREIGLSVRYTWSCASTDEAILNADRWLGGSPALDLSVKRYRRLLVNHEVGHLLGHRHRLCPGSGLKAPVMMQQSKGLHGCRANPWPLASEL